MAKKPKAVRIVRFAHSEILRESGLFIPNGASVPLPASVRRVMRAAVAWRHSGHVTGLCMAMTTKLTHAVDAYERAKKRAEKCTCGFCHDCTGDYPDTKGGK